MNLTFTKATAMFHTPARKTAGSPVSEGSPRSVEKAGTSQPSVRRSGGDCEAAASSNTDPAPPLTTKTILAGPTKVVQKPPESQENKTILKGAKLKEVHTPPKLQYADRSTEARACLNKAKLHLSSSRNTKNEIKTAITEALDRLYQLVKDGDRELKTKNSGGVKENTVPEVASTEATVSINADQNLLSTQIEEHSKLLQENNKRMGELKEMIERHADKIEKPEAPTYAGVTATRGEGSMQKRTLHSVAVTSSVETETGEEVLERVRKAIDAKEGWVEVERVRKAKNRKVIMGFGSREERDKVKDRIGKEGGSLIVEDVENKDPLVRLGDVLSVHTDEDVLKALRNQNGAVFRGLGEGEDRVVVKYRKRARNPLTSHIIISVSPSIWRRVTERGHVYIDLQRVRAEDQTPLVQCTRCLGYGHGRKYCQETADACSHCGGPHLRAECADWLAGETPACRNCKKAKLTQLEHNAFSSGCPVRRRWDELARSTVAYC